MPDDDLGRLDNLNVGRKVCCQTGHATGHFLHDGVVGERHMCYRGLLLESYKLFWRPELGSLPQATANALQTIRVIAEPPPADAAASMDLPMRLEVVGGH